MKFKVNLGMGVAACCVFAAPLFAQDSISNGACLPGDALSPWDASLQCADYVVDLSSFNSSWGTEWAIGVLSKSSKSSSSFQNSLISAQSMSRVPVEVPFDGTAYDVWAAASDGINPTENNGAGSTTPSGNALQFAATYAEFATTDAGANYNAVISHIVRMDPTDPTRLYVRRVPAVVNSPSGLVDQAQFGMGSIDANGNTIIRGDGFGVGAGGISGDNIYNINASARDCGTVNNLNAANQPGNDAAAGQQYVFSSGDVHSPGNLVPASVNGGTPIYIGNNFNNAYCRSAGGVAVCDGSHLAPGVVDTRGTVAYTTNNFPVVGGSLGTAAVLAKDGAGLTDNINIWGIGAGGAVTGSITAKLPAGGVTDPKTGFNSLDLDPLGTNEFDHYHSQAAFRGGTSQVALGINCNGDLVATAECDHPSDGGSTWNLNFFPVAHIDPATGATTWTMAGYGGIAEDEAGGPVGKPIYDGNPASGGSIIGQMSRLDRVTGGAPFGPSVSSPMIDAAGNIWFISSIELFNAPGTADNEFNNGLLRAVYDPATNGYDLELIAKLGDVFSGLNSTRDYIITFMGIADSNSVSSGTAFSGNIAENAHLNGSPVCDDQSDTCNLGGLVLSVEITYDDNGDGLFDGCNSAGGGDEEYQVLLYLGSPKTSCGVSAGTCAQVLADDRFNVNSTVKACNTDADCQAGVPGPSSQTVCRDSACYVARSRYLSVRPNPANAGVNRAIRVSLSTGEVLGWASAATDVAVTGPGPNLFHVSRVDAAPTYFDWSTLSEGVLTIGDCEIAPGFDYVVQCIEDGLDIADEANYSAPLTLPTSDNHGDITGGGSPGAPPNGQVSLTDAFAAILGFQNTQNEPKDWLDLEPNTGPAVPNLTVNLADVFQAVQGFQNVPYPGPAPTACP